VIASILKLGGSGGCGALLGIAAVWWIEPTTAGGTALLVAIGIIVGMVAGSIVSHLGAARRGAAADQAAHRAPGRD
jgi:hypothetical protein